MLDSNPTILQGQKSVKLFIKDARRASVIGFQSSGRDVYHLEPWNQIRLSKITKKGIQAFIKAEIERIVGSKSSGHADNSQGPLDPNPAVVSSKEDRLGLSEAGLERIAGSKSIGCVDNS